MYTNNFSRKYYGYGLTNPIVIAIFVMTIITIVFFITEGASFKECFIIGGCCVFCPLYIYSLPSIVALSKKHPEFFLIFMVNMLLGCTVIGWLLALLWGARKF